MKIGVRVLEMAHPDGLGNTRRMDCIYMGDRGEHGWPRQWMVRLSDRNPDGERAVFGILYAHLKQHYGESFDPALIKPVPLHDGVPMSVVEFEVE